MIAIEILQEEPLAVLPLNAFSFALRHSRPPESIREPSMWQSRFTEVGGALYHLGNSELKEQDGAFFDCYDLIVDEESLVTKLVFKGEYVDDVFALVAILLKQSRVERIHFTSDYQACTLAPRIYSESLTIARFRELHDSGHLYWNSWVTVAGR
jgi:hypothetical protein